MVKDTNEKIKKVLKNYIKRINKKFRIEKAIFFGSRVRGDYFLDSDVDLILVSKDFEKLNFRERMGEVIGEWDASVDLEVICYTPKEFEKKKGQIGIIPQAVKEGVLIR